MAEVPVGSDAVADALLEFLELGKAAFRLPRPDRLAVDAHLEDAAGSGNQRDAGEFLFESGQQFLRHPTGAQQPATLGAVLNLDTRQTRHPFRSTGQTGVACRALGLRSAFAKPSDR